MTSTTLGTASIPVPPSSSNSTTPITGTGITVEAGVYYRVRVEGTVTASTNESWDCLPGPQRDLAGGYGPTGVGGVLQVQLEYSYTDGSGTSTLFFDGSASTGSSAQTAIIHAAKQLTIRAGRTGIASECNHNNGTPVIPGYYLSGSQTVTVEKLTHIVQLKPSLRAVKHGTKVIFTASRDDGGDPHVSGWHWQPDAGAAGSATDPCWWLNPCEFTPQGSGTMTQHGDFGDETTHVDVYTNFTLSVDNGSVHPGESTTFHTGFDGNSGPVTRWKWFNDDGSPSTDPDCAGETTNCEHPVHKSGHMCAYMESGGTVADSACVDVSVLPRRRLRLSPLDTVWVIPDSLVLLSASAEGAPIVGATWSGDDYTPSLLANRTGGRSSAVASKSLRPGLSSRLLTGVASSTCFADVTVCTDKVVGDYIRTITATVDDSLQTASVIVRAYTVEEVLVSTTCETSDDDCWPVPDSLATGDSSATGDYDYVAPLEVTRVKMKIDFTDQFDGLHIFNFINVTLHRVRNGRLNPGRDGWRQATYSIDWMDWSEQTPAIPGEQMLYLRAIPIASRMLEISPGNFSGPFWQNGKARGEFIYKRRP